MLYPSVLSHHLVQEPVSTSWDDAPNYFFEEVDTGSSKDNSVNQELRAVDLIESDRQPLWTTVGYLGVDVEDALMLAEGAEI
jgi:hypothetical protein